MRVTILGCSGGIAADSRTTCLLLDDDILVDAGTGAGDLTRDALLRIDSVFLTHAHLDHIALLPMLVNMAGPHRKTPIDIYALPETITALRQHIFNFRIWPDYTAPSVFTRPYLAFRPIGVGETVELSGRRITPLPVRHTIPAVAYRLDSGAASCVFSGDTGYHEPFWEALRGMDDLRHLMIEVTFPDDDTGDASASGHMHPELLVRGLANLDGSRPLDVLISHMEPGREEAIMAGILARAGAFPAFSLKRLERGQVYSF